MHDLAPLPSWDHWLDNFRSFERQIEKLTSDLFKSLDGQGLGVFWDLPEPKITESPAGVEIRFPVKGAAPGSVDVAVGPRQVGVKGQISRREESKDGGFQKVFKESFYRVVPLPATVDPDSAETEVLRDVIVVRAKKAK